MRWKRSGRAEFRPCRSDRADVSRLCCLVRLAPFLFFADVPLFLFTREYAKLSRKQRPRRLQTQRAKEVFTFDRVLSLLTVSLFSLRIRSRDRLGVLQRFGSADQALLRGMYTSTDVKGIQRGACSYDGTCECKVCQCDVSVSASDCSRTTASQGNQACHIKLPGAPTAGTAP